jgi:hypothetical protein
MGNSVRLDASRRVVWDIELGSFTLGHDSPKRLIVGPRFVAVTALPADRSREAPDQRHASSSPGPGATSLVPGRPVPSRLTGSALWRRR